MGLTVSSIPSGGGGSLPQLPIWSFQASVVDPVSTTPITGKFVTNSATTTGTTFIKFSNTPKAGGPSFFNGTYDLVGEAVAWLVNVTTGKSYAFSGSNGQGAGSILLAVEGELATNSDEWSGDYSLVMLPQSSAVTLALAIQNTPGLVPISDGSYDVIGPNSNGSITFSSGLVTAYLPAS